MAAIVPFHALRPVPDAAARVAAVPYDVVSSDEARALADGNPLSFLHVSRAEIDLPRGVDPYSDDVYAKAVSNFARLRRAAPLVIESAPTLYAYQLRMNGHVQTGVAGCFSLAEYESGVIKKHEHTRPDKEDDRTRHMIALRAQTGPVFLTYRASRKIDEAVDRTGSTKPLIDFVAADGVQHTIWPFGPAETGAIVAAFADVSSLYIADGHHRAASAWRTRNSGATGGESESFLAVAFPDAQMQVLPYNRVVKDLGTNSLDGLLSSLRQIFTVREGPAMPERRGDVSMFLGGHWYTIVLGPPSNGLSPADRLDVSRLQDEILGPLLSIGDPRSDKRIEFVGGARGTSELEALVESGRAAVAFSMFPVSVNDLMETCDAGGIMPPKSTWFEPKLRDGLLTHLL